MSRLGLRPLAKALTVLSVITFAIGGYATWRAVNQQNSGTSVLPNGNFNVSTMQRLYSALNPSDFSQLDHQVYVVTGGLGMAKPRIMAWDPVGDVTLGQAYGTGTAIFSIQEFGPELQTATRNGKPLPWVKKKTASGTAYYQYVWSPKNPYSPIWYYFKKGNTFIRLTVSGVKGVYPFPQGLPNHMRLMSGQPPIRSFDSSISS